MTSLEDLGELRDFGDGEVVFDEGTSGRCLYTVVSGAVSIRKTGDVVATVLTEVGPGELLGEMSLVENKPHSATAIAIGPTTLAFMDRDTFLSALRQNPEIALRVMSSLAGRLRDTTDKLQQIATLHVLDRTELALIQKAILESDLI